MTNLTRITQELVNNANVLGLPANYVSKEKALAMVNQFFTTDFEGGRHERRVNKIPVRS